MKNNLPTPYYIVDETLVLRNLKILQQVIDRTGCKILLAQKAFSMYSMYPLIGKYLHGTTASGLFEARLGYEEMGKENHIFSPVYLDGEFDTITDICDHIIFNSFDQWQKFKDKALLSGREFGIRINPECSTGNHALYDPCSPGSRLGVTLKNFQMDLLDGITGLHFHTLCEQDADALITTVKAVEEKFGKWLYQMKWLNIGGGHHITRDGYDIDALVDCVNRLQEKYNLQVYIEPGEAVVLNTGFLVSTVIDIVANESSIAILDTSASCHMPDVLEMPYRPEVIGAGKDKEKKYTYILGGPTCLAGDIMGIYSFDRPLKVGDKITFCDMAHYSMVKNNTFNGIPLPLIVIKSRLGEYKVIREFGYQDFKYRLS